LAPAVGCNTPLPMAIFLERRGCHGAPPQRFALSAAMLLTILILALQHSCCTWRSFTSFQRQLSGRCALQKVNSRGTTLEASSLLDDVVEKTPLLVAQRYYSDAWGSYNMTWSRDGTCDLELTGFGTTKLVQRMCREAAEIIARFDPSLELRALADMRRGFGCSPGAFSSATSFLRETGPRWVRAVVVAPGPVAAIADLSMRVARIQGVRFVGNKDSADVRLSS